MPKTERSGIEAKALNLYLRFCQPKWYDEDFNQSRSSGKTVFRTSDSRAGRSSKTILPDHCSLSHWPVRILLELPEGLQTVVWEECNISILLSETAELLLWRDRWSRLNLPWLLLPFTLESPNLTKSKSFRTHSLPDQCCPTTNLRDAWSTTVAQPLQVKMSTRPLMKIPCLCSVESFLSLKTQRTGSTEHMQRVPV